MNVDGLREAGKFFACEDFAARETPDILIVTETQKTASEARGLVIEGFLVITKHSMP